MEGAVEEEPPDDHTSKVVAPVVSHSSSYHSSDSLPSIQSSLSYEDNFVPSNSSSMISLVEPTADPSIHDLTLGSGILHIKQELDTDHGNEHSTQVGDIPSQSGDVPEHVLNAISMPTNWNQVERLKQQKNNLHEKLFTHRLNVSKNMSCTDEEVAEHELNDDSEKLVPGTQSETDSDNESYDENSLQIALNEGNIGTESCKSPTKFSEIFPEIGKSSPTDNNAISNFIKKLSEQFSIPRKSRINPRGSKSETSATGSCDTQCSDLCELSATDINQSLQRAIDSVEMKATAFDFPPKPKLVKGGGEQNEKNLKDVCHHYVVPKPSPRHSQGPSVYKSRSEGSVVAVPSRANTPSPIPRESRMPFGKKTETTSDTVLSLGQQSTSNSFTETKCSGSKDVCTRNAPPAKAMLKKWLERNKKSQDSKPENSTSNSKQYLEFKEMSRLQLNILEKKLECLQTKTKLMKCIQKQNDLKIRMNRDLDSEIDTSSCKHSHCHNTEISTNAPDKASECLDTAQLEKQIQLKPEENTMAMKSNSSSKEGGADLNYGNIALQKLKAWERLSANYKNNDNGEELDNRNYSSSDCEIIDEVQSIPEDKSGDYLSGKFRVNESKERPKYTFRKSKMMKRNYSDDERDALCCDVADETFQCDFQKSSDLETDIIRDATKSEQSGSRHPIGKPCSSPSTLTKTANAVPLVPRTMSAAITAGYSMTNNEATPHSSTLSKTVQGKSSTRSLLVTQQDSANKVPVHLKATSQPEPDTCSTRQACSLSVPESIAPNSISPAQIGKNSCSEQLPVAGLGVDASCLVVPPASNFGTFTTSSMHCLTSPVSSTASNGTPFFILSSGTLHRPSIHLICSPDGLLYTIADNVLKPVVQEINGSYQQVNQKNLHGFTQKPIPVGRPFSLRKTGPIVGVVNPSIVTSQTSVKSSTAVKPTVSRSYQPINVQRYITCTSSAGVNAPFTCSSTTPVQYAKNVASAPDQLERTAYFKNGKTLSRSQKMQTEMQIHGSMNSEREGNPIGAGLMKAPLSSTGLTQAASSSGGLVKVAPSSAAMVTTAPNLIKPSLNQNVCRGTPVSDNANEEMEVDTQTTKPVKSSDSHAEISNSHKYHGKPKKTISAAVERIVKALQSNNIPATDIDLPENESPEMITTLSPTTELQTVNPDLADTAVTSLDKMAGSSAHENTHVSSVSADIPFSTKELQSNSTEENRPAVEADLLRSQTDEKANEIANIRTEFHRTSEANKLVSNAIFRIVSDPNVQAIVSQSKADVENRQKRLKKRRFKKRKSHNTGRKPGDIKTPVPFLNFPARIITTSSPDSGRETSMIIASPKIRNIETEQKSTVCSTARIGGMHRESLRANDNRYEHGNVQSYLTSKLAPPIDSNNSNNAESVAMQTDLLEQEKKNKDLEKLEEEQATLLKYPVEFYCSNQVDSDNESYDSVDLERYEDTRRNCDRSDGSSSRTESCHSGIEKSEKMGKIEIVPSDKVVTAVPMKHEGGVSKVMYEREIQGRHLEVKQVGSEMYKALSEALQTSETLSSANGGAAKKLIKSKFIILKGEICDRWLEVKSATCSHSMNDAEFIKYLLVQASMRQQQGSSTHPCPGSECDTVALSQDDPACHSAVVHEGMSPGLSDSPHKVVSAVCEDGPPEVIGSRSDPGPLRQSDSFTSDVQESSPEALHETFSPPVAVEYIQLNLSEMDPKKTVDMHPRKRQASPSESPDNAKRQKFEKLSEASQTQVRWALSVFTDWMRNEGEEVLVTFKDEAWIRHKFNQFCKKATSYAKMPNDFVQVLKKLWGKFPSYFSLEGNLDVADMNESIDLSSLYSDQPSQMPDSNGNECPTSVAQIPSIPVNEVIIAEDLDKLYRSTTLSDRNPVALLWKVWFDVTFHLSRGRLRDRWHLLRKNSFDLCSDSKGVFYVLSEDVIKELKVKTEERRRMYATPDNGERCPVRTLSLYLSRLNPNCQALFQFPRRTWVFATSCWYLPKALTRDQIRAMMRRISKHAGLSRVYGNNSVVLTATVAS